MSVINTNVNSLVSQVALHRNERSLSTTMQQLSTGSRINSAKDDAAGLAISSRMTAQIRGLNQAVRNANDGISMLQTAEGATVEMTNMLQRMRELAVQSRNDTNTQADRDYLDLEYQQLAKEISRTASTTEWNGISLMNNSSGLGVDDGTGDARTVSFQVGANADQTISIDMKDFSFNTGTPAVASEKQLNLGVVDFSGGNGLQVVKFSMGTGGAQTDFTVTLAVGDALSGAPGATTSAETATLRDAISTVVNNTVGFEGVSIESSGSVITITDSEGRAITDLELWESDATTAADGSDETPTGANTTIAAGTLASGASAPATDSVFSSSARLNNTDITSTTNADTAIARLDSAIDAINEQRATMGAVMNRLTYASDSLANAAANTSASRSRIQDTDYAVATTEMARSQIIQQAATAMLAQANQQPQSVLSLLK